MAAISSKYHLKIGDLGFLLAKQARTERHIYTREEAPAFVNKFSSGEPNYRDSTFFPHWVQLNWLNGFNQEFFDDGGKFYRSSAVDTTDQLKLTLQKLFSSNGQTAASVNITAQEAWRAAASSAFGTGADGALTISVDTTDAPIDSAFIGTIGATTGSATNTSFAAGQHVLIHQTRGTGAGNWMKNKITNYSAGTITLETALNATYVTGAQIIVMKQYTNVTINSGKTLTAKAWNETVGGIITFLCNGTLTVTGTITATGKGFLGGGNETTDPSNQQAQAGEGTAGTKVKQTTANGNGGGGGYEYDPNDAGGGGGGHATAGSAGASGGGSSIPGAAGSLVGQANLNTSMFFGGGGGGGAAVGGNTGGAGGNGGGIIYLQGLTITITGNINCNGNNGTDATAGGGGGAGGSILLKTQTGTLGSSLVTASAGTGGTGTRAGGNGAVGRIHLDYSSSYTGTTTPTLDSTQDGSLSSTPAGSSFTHIVGTSAGKVYSSDDAGTLTELFDTRRLEWFETGTDANKVIGDTGGTETAQAQSFQLDATCKVKAIQVYLKKNTGTPGNITVRIETNSTDKPSGTLADTNAATILTAFTDTSYGWKTIEFPDSFSLTGSTVYWIVLKTAAAGNDNFYHWAADDSSPGYTPGTMAASTDGGSTWAAVTGSDAYFRVLSAATSVNTMIISSLSGSSRLYIGVGSQTSTNAGDARLYNYDGTNFTLIKIFASTNEASVNCIVEYGSSTTKAYIGLGAIAKIYTTTDWSTFTLAKTITIPNNPGQVLTMVEYNKKLYIGGGYPSLLSGNNYQYGGFLYSYDEFSWENVFPFDHTVITSLENFDTLMFIGTIKKRLYVFNTASIDKLFEFPWNVQISDMTKWDDKLALAIAPTPGSAVSGYEGIYLFDRNGFHNAFNVASRSWYSIFVFNNNLIGGNDDGYIYKTNANTYQATGWLQTSYDEAQLPSIEKIRRSVTLIFESLPEGCSIEAQYKTDESDASWTSLGTADTDGDTIETFNFASGVYSKKISYKVILTTTTPANTPTLKKIIHKYVLSPDFKYMWKMKLLCCDEIQWLDGTEPAGLLNADVSAGATSITLKSTDDATPTTGFPDPNGSVMYASIINQSTGVRDRFSYTGKTSTTLTGIPATGTYAIGSHSANDPVKITGGDLHQAILTIKQTRQLFTLTDIDGLTYTVFFHSYQSDAWSINMDDFVGGLENEIPITLLEA